jgi:hypothetical protein
VDIGLPLGIGAAPPLNFRIFGVFLIRFSKSSSVPLDEDLGLRNEGVRVGVLDRLRDRIGGLVELLVLDEDEDGVVINGVREEVRSWGFSESLRSRSIFPATVKLLASFSPTCRVRG